MKRIDAHTHVYSTDDVRYPSIPSPTRPPGTSGSFAALKKLADENEVSRMCVLQPSSFYGWDNRFVCDLALHEGDRIAAICTLNPEDCSSPALVTRLIEQYGIRGIRSLPASNGCIDHPGVKELWRACAENDLTINVFVKYGLADQLVRLLDEFTDIPCVIDHCLLLDNGPAHDEILASMLRLAHYPNTYAKLSFMPFSTVEEYPYAGLHDSCRKIIAAYTPGRCVWGSNFPTALWSPKSKYCQNVELFTSELGLSTQTQEDIFWNTPWRLWFERR